ncbi:proton-conducting transporter transmembrane domain-containing protein [Actinomadura monticuli]|uniref:Complex I subunit 5 family protein n=1 Tax=Actinomadura monticuli TaxID=3097367 RepID=A0ABV4QAE9_9ACTN
MLAFLAGMVGFVLSGDLFNIFVFLELMSVAAYALSGYHVTRPEVLQGALDFAVLNTIGTLTPLMGIAVLYGHTGNLNLVGMGTALARDHPSGLLVLALTLITVGFLVKAGTAPFHFWLANAYGVATAPSAAIFTAVMSDLAFDVYSRVHATVFAPTTGTDDAVRNALLALALLSALLGAVMCFLEADLKRQLAFMTVSNGGIVLAGMATLTDTGLAGSIMYIITAGLLHGALTLFHPRAGWLITA